jgi:hypothetical protein
MIQPCCGHLIRCLLVKIILALCILLLAQANSPVHLQAARISGRICKHQIRSSDSLNLHVFSLVAPLNRLRIQVICYCTSTGSCLVYFLLRILLIHISF